MTTKKMPNRLIQEKSPYLLQHAYNPVDWLPWCEEAFAKAKAEDKPIFLSIGYSTCHWCHVMAHESFEDEVVAKILNKSFISIKVDREERPDIDSIYMSFCQAFNGSGGWPLTIVMTPEGEPFFAGTYIPKHAKYNLGGLIDILNRIVELWHSDRKSFTDYALKAKEALDKELNVAKPKVLSEDIIAKAVQELKKSFERNYGGFSDAPKFPIPHNLMFLMRAYKMQKEEALLHMVEHTLKSMYRGGIFDHIGFGFSRYSTDKKWLVPHFEKMLYDNALLLLAYTEGYELTGELMYKEVAEKIISYVLRALLSPQGGFYCGEDADSEGVEGKFYVWTVDEVKAVLGEERGELFCHSYDITTDGNFEGKNIPNLIHNEEELSSEQKKMLEESRKLLFEHREKRIHPHKDDKILTYWNGLIIAALSYAGRIFKSEEYISAARTGANFILNTMVDEGGRLYSRFRDGEVEHKGYLEDYANISYGLIELYEATLEEDYLRSAERLTSSMLELFWDFEHGGLFLYGSDAEQLILRPKEIYDGALPSGNSVAAYNLLRLGSILERQDFIDHTEKIFEAFGERIEKIPSAHCFLLLAYSYNKKLKKL